MSLIVKPNQAFYVVYASQLSLLQAQSLTLLYQPIITSKGLSLYHTMSHLPNRTRHSSQTTLHAQLCQLMNCGIQEIIEGRSKLEAVGLLTSYRDKTSHEDWKLQSLVYDLHEPLTPLEFMDNQLLASSLYRAIGSDQFQQLLDYFQVSDLKLVDRLVDISLNYQNVFNEPNPIPAYEASALEEGNLQSQYSQNAEKTDLDFDYSMFLQYLQGQGMASDQFTQFLQTHVLAVAASYNLNELQMVQVVRQAYNATSGQIQVDQIRSVADKMTHYAYRRAGQQDGVATNQGFPYQYSPDQAKDRQENLSKDHPHLSLEDIELILLCEQIPNASFVNKVKESKGGFATDAERYYVNDLLNKTQLKPEVINLLIYYLLIFQNRDHIYKGDLERHASLWQQQGIDDLVKGIDHIHFEQKQEAIQAKQKKQQKRSNYGRRHYEEVKPAWMQSQDQTHESKSATNDNIQDIEDEASIRRRLNELFGEGE